MFLEVQTLEGESLILGRNNIESIIEVQADDERRHLLITTNSGKEYAVNATKDAILDGEKLKRIPSAYPDADPLEDTKRCMKTLA